MDFSPKTPSAPKPGTGGGYKKSPLEGLRGMDRKKAAIYGAAALVIIVIALAAPSITGLVTASNAMAKELNLTKQNLASCNVDLGRVTSDADGLRNDVSSCQSSLGGAQSSLQDCDNSKSSLQNSVDACQSDRDGLAGEISGLQNDVDKYKSGYDILAENYAIDVCCTRGVTQAQWDVVDNAISCINGTRTLTC